MASFSFLFTTHPQKTPIRHDPISFQQGQSTSTNLYMLWKAINIIIQDTPLSMTSNNTVSKDALIAAGKKVPANTFTNQVSARAIQRDGRLPATFLLLAAFLLQYSVPQGAK